MGLKRPRVSPGAKTSPFHQLLSPLSPSSSTPPRISPRVCTLYSTSKKTTTTSILTDRSRSFHSCTRPIASRVPLRLFVTTASSVRYQFTDNVPPLAAQDETNFPPQPNSNYESLNAHTTTAQASITLPPLLYHPAHTQSRNRHYSRIFNKSPVVQISPPPAGVRLWNPINYVPRVTVLSTRRGKVRDEEIGFAAPDRDAYPLLSLPASRPQRTSASPTSLAVEYSFGEAESGRTSIALPGSRQRTSLVEPVEEHRDMPTEENATHRSGHIAPDDGTMHPPRHAQSSNSLRPSTFASYPSNGGNNATGAGPDSSQEIAWGPAHPCFPHMNPHVPLQSEEFTTTRIIRIRRDWMVKGDLAPAFSNLYPEILDPLLPEQEFRRIIAKINGELVKAFDPFSLRNWLDAAMGLLTGWLWEGMGFAGIKSHLQRVEEWLEKWNREVGSKNGVRIWSLRRTAYMTLDIQIPDPKVGLVNPEDASMPGTRPHTGLDPETLTAPTPSHLQ